MKINSINNLTKGIVKENPVFVMMLGMCPTLGVTTSLINSLGMGLATLFVLIFSNITISSLKHLIPSAVRIPCYIVIIASFVTIIELLMEAYFPSLYAQLGIFLSLIVVNCIILGRAEAFASKNSVFQSFLDALGTGLGFILALAALGAVREILGSGTLMGANIIANSDNSLKIFISPPGAFLALAGLIIIFNHFKEKN